MIYISHRGNLTGPDLSKENTKEYIDAAISQNFDVEIDLWYVNGKLWLGHDGPEYSVEPVWLEDRASHLWIHTKNIEAALWLSNQRWKPHFFTHVSDPVAITSLGWLWCHVWDAPLNSNAVVPLLNKESIANQKWLQCGAICTDFVYDAMKKFGV